MREVIWAKLDWVGLHDCYGTAKRSFRNLARLDQGQERAEESLPMEQALLAQAVDASAQSSQPRA